MKKYTFLILLIISISFSFASAQTAKEIVQKADKLFQGESNYTEMTMTIVRPKWKRTVSFKSCSKGTEYSLTVITAPAKEKGQTFMKRKNGLWSWNPRISRLIKLPPSMMSQGWMGSDFSNDDLLKESSIVKDYTHKIAGEVTVSGRKCYKIILTPKPNAVVVWGKLVKMISKKDFLQLKTEYYDEDGYLVKTEIASKIKKTGGRTIPTHFELIPSDEPGNKTILDMKKVRYNIKVSHKFFSKQKMKKGTAIKFPK